MKSQHFGRISFPFEVISNALNAIQKNYFLAVIELMIEGKLLAEVAGNFVERLETARKWNHFSAFQVNASKLGNGKMWSISLFGCS